jgi:hypothetical protein
MAGGFDIKWYRLPGINYLPNIQPYQIFSSLSRFYYLLCGSMRTLVMQKDFHLQMGHK